MTVHLIDESRLRTVKCTVTVIPALTGIASFVYDGSGRRQSLTEGSTTLTGVYDGYDPVQEQSGSSVLANLLTGLGIDERFIRTESSTTSTFLFDALGSTVALTNSSAAVQTSYSYDPYGVTSTSGSASDNPYQFTGRQNDGTGLYYYRARYYNPAWGRFISEDPAQFRSGINLFAYAYGNPLTFTDPTGEGSIGNWLRTCGIIIGLATPGSGDNPPSAIGNEPSPVPIVEPMRPASGQGPKPK